MTTMPQLPAPAELYAQLAQITESAKTWSRLMTTTAKIAQTPKELIWTLNKAKLYGYIPVVPAEQCHGIPLLLVFAIMNRPYALDLRPGHSFVDQCKPNAGAFKRASALHGFDGIARIAAAASQPECRFQYPAPSVRRRSRSTAG
jgi:hypothetical protein